MWRTLAHLQTTASVPEGMVIGTTVYDPRLKFVFRPDIQAHINHPFSLKQTTSLKHDQPASQNLQIWPTAAIASSDLWDEKTRRRLSKPRFTKKDIDERKAKVIILFLSHVRISLE